VSFKKIIGIRPTC